MQVTIRTTNAATVGVATVALFAGLTALLPPAQADGRWRTMAGAPSALSGHSYTSIYERSGSIFVGGGGVLAAFDGGRWHTWILGDGPVIHVVTGAPDGHVYAIGNFNAVYRWSGEAWAREHLDMRSGPTAALTSIHTIRGVTFALGPDRGGGRRTVLRRSGSRWIYAALPAELQLPRSPCPMSGYVDYTRYSAVPYASCAEGLYLWRAGSWHGIGKPEEYRPGQFIVWLIGDCIFATDATIRDGVFRRCPEESWVRWRDRNRIRAIAARGAGLVAVSPHRVLERRDESNAGNARPERPENPPVVRPVSVRPVSAVDRRDGGPVGVEDRAPGRR